MKWSSFVEERRGPAGRLAALAGACLALAAWAAVQDRAPVARAVEGEGEPKTREEAAVDLEIFHGQFGSPVSEQDEETKGATTVANKNDTDGDGTADNADDTVETAPTTLTAGAAQGATSLQVASVAHFSKGTTVLVRKADENDWAKDPAKWEVGRITEIGAGQTLTLAAGLHNGYAAGDLVCKPEVDLMRLVLHKPQGEGGKVKLSKVEGDFKVWKQPIKGTPETHEVALPAEYDLADLPKTLWVEATETSGKLQSIALTMEYPGAVADTVKATAAWCEKTTREPEKGSNPWLTRQADEDSGWPHNPKVGPGGQLPDLNAEDLVRAVNLDDIAVDGSRYGFGTMVKRIEGDMRVGGRILLEYKLLPDGVRDLGVAVDVTRQKWTSNWYIVFGEKTIRPYQRGFSNWPWQETPARDSEEPNDDGEATDEDNASGSQLAYSFDSPSAARAATIGLETWAFEIYRSSFVEWSRILLDGGDFSNTDGLVEGSRSSVKKDWHTVRYLKRNAQDKLEEDRSGKAAAACAPRRHANGALSVSVVEANCESEGWSVAYDAANNEWLVKNSVGTPRGTLRYIAGSDPRRWSGKASLEGNDWLELDVAENAGRTFADGERFRFSTFRSGETVTGKQNAIREGAFPVEGEGGTVP